MDEKTLIEHVYMIRTFNNAVDVYCPICTKLSTFRHLEGEDIKPRQGSNLIWKLTGDADLNELTNYSFKEKLICTRDLNHEIIIFAFAHKNYIIKIGQYPSIADLESGEILKYKKVLEQPLYKEFSKAIGLKSHGIGVGSFVYLRRIFEKLLENAHQSMKSHQEWNENIYNKSRVDEKILLLKTELPEFLVENRNLYGILSKGIHELTEDECLEYFEVVKTSIEIILNEMIRRKEQDDKVNEMKKAIGGIVQKIIKK
ncbi:MAG TPA: short-chain dehydrogenase [Ignavibacteria bacterium]